jgi:uncharacterized protein
MTVQVSYPGVYIDEFTPGAPIAGVGTSTAAFIGVAASGPLDLPTKVTSWDQFKRIYGEQPVPGFQLWYAVRGFFQNGGTVCYVVRASNGSHTFIAIENRAGSPAFLVRARQPGAVQFELEVEEVHLVHNSSLYLPTADVDSHGGREFVVQSEGGPQTAEVVAARFRPGDVVTVGASGERLDVVKVSGGTIRVAREPQNTYGNGDLLRLADATAGTRTFRLALDPSLNGQEILFPGTILTITQGTNTITRIVESAFPEHLPTIAKPTYRVTLRRGSDVTFDLGPSGAPTSVQSEELEVRVKMDGASTPLVFAGLGFDAAHPRFYQKMLNEAPEVPITFEPIEPAALGTLPGALPEIIVNPNQKHVGGADGTLGAIEDLGNLAAQDFVDALDALETIDDVNLVACPDDTSDAVQQAMVSHCERMADRFAILDSRAGAPPFGANSVETHRPAVVSPRGYAALYYPWLRVPPLGPGAPILVPPSGHVCGVIARSDASRGVHKAPANEIFAGALGVERVLSDTDHGQLNLQGINVTRVFGGVGRPTLFGARTTASDLNWLHVSTRRLFLYLEESIAEGIRWAIFEPNNHQLWKKLKRSITEFLVRVWRDGGLFGATREEAFYVRIDEDLNPFSEQALGRLHIEIGLRPTYPAEFIVVHIGIWPGGSEIVE